MQIQTARSITLGLIGLALALALPISAGATPQATTSGSPFDASFANNGRLLLPRVSGYSSAIAGTCRAVDGKLLVSGIFGYGAASKTLGLAAIKNPAASGRRGARKISRWKLQRVPRGAKVVAQEFADDGSFAYATQGGAGSTRRTLQIFRVDSRGHRERAFGGDGIVRMTIPGLRVPNADAVRILIAKDRSIFLLVETSDETIITRFTRRGALNTNWGISGRVTLGAGSSLSWGAMRVIDSATLLAGDGLMIARVPNDPGATSDLIRFSPSGELDASFAGSGSWRAPDSSSPTDTTKGQILRTAAMPDGRYSAVYADGRADDDFASFDLKLAVFDPSNGAISATSSNFGHYSTGGDGGFPDDYAWRLGELRGDPAFFTATTFSSGTNFSSGQASRLPLSSGSATTKTKSIRTSKQSITDFALVPGSHYAYSCGGAGLTTSATTKSPSQIGLRRFVEIRRMKL